MEIVGKVLLGLVALSLNNFFYAYMIRKAIRVKLPTGALLGMKLKRLALILLLGLMANLSMVVIKPELWNMWGVVLVAAYVALIEAAALAQRFRGRLETPHLTYHVPSVVRVFSWIGLGQLLLLVLPMTLWVVGLVGGSIMTPFAGVFLGSWICTLVLLWRVRQREETLGEPIRLKAIEADHAPQGFLD